MNNENAKQQMRKGVLELCILSIISEREAYPSDMIKRLEQSDMIVVEGTVYPLLTRLKNTGLLQYTWQESKEGPPRKYFQLTSEGEVFLQEMKESWTKLVASVDNIIEKSNKTTSNE
jgi:PadR family transcriptional regulator, regulatory protein PadR